MSNQSLQEQSEDDVSGILYIPMKLDYMRDIFRPKPFVKELKSAPSICSPLDSMSTGQMPAHISVYENDMITTKKSAVDQKAPGSHFVFVNEEEEREAMKYMLRISEIERQFQDHSKSNSTVNDVSFHNSNCSCVECMPKMEEEVLYCELCHITLGRDDWITHTRSISHQMKRSFKSDLYINPNIDLKSDGYRIMKSMGWKEGEGLGKEGEGKLEPIATRLKNDHLGLGCKTQAPLRITHTPHNGDCDTNEPKAVSKERERLIKKYGYKRLQRIIKKYNAKKEKRKLLEKEQQYRDEFQL